MKTQKDYINNGIYNLSLVRKFPTYKETHDEKVSKKYADTTDFYYIYDLNKREIGKYLNTWFRGTHNTFKNYVTNDEMWIVKKVDSATVNHLYCRYYNPIAIRIVCPVGAKFKKNEKGDDLYNMKACIHSIDDSSYGIYFEQMPYDVLEDIRIEIMKWINSKTEINGDDFLNYCIGLGADEKSIDYN